MILLSIIQQEAAKTLPKHPLSRPCKLSRVGHKCKHQIQCFAINMIPMTSRQQSATTPHSLFTHINHSDRV